MKKKSFEMRTFYCPECGTKVYAAKTGARMTAQGHVKTMQCPFCLVQQDFIQDDYRPMEGEDDEED